MTSQARPFHRAEYVSTYPGPISLPEGAPCPVRLREIPGSEFRDGELPWPYVWLPEEEGAGLSDLHPGLVTLTGVLAPSPDPPWGDHPDLVRLKDHFLHDPGLPSPELGKRSRAHLSAGRRVWRFAVAEGPQDWRDCARLYRDLVARRGLGGGRFDFGEEHFSGLSRLPGFHLFGVRGEAGWGAMACGARHLGELHLLHLVVGDRGLRTDASYVLLDGLLAWTRELGLWLFLGGAPAGDDGGVERFKRRWSNRVWPSWLLRRVIRPEVYRELPVRDPGFFPAYRGPGGPR